MRWSVLALVFTWGLLASGSGRPALGQISDAGCLKPLPLLDARSDVLRRDQGRGGEVEGRQRYFIAPSGELCRTFNPGDPPPTLGQSAVDRAPTPGRAFLFSAILPGAGQWYLGQDRWPAYVAIEAWAWIQLLDWRREGHKLEDQYKDLAWFVARRVSTGPRTDAGWEYYESMTKFQSSGAFDSDPLAPGVQPEEDPTTFNGSMWVLAREIYLPGDLETPVDVGSEPYQRAFSYYLSRAYAPELAWDWGANALLQEEYAALIQEADEALRSSTRMIGMILANHLLAAVDALVSGRLGIAGETEPSLELLLLPGPYNRQSLALHVRLPSPFSHGH